MLPDGGAPLRYRPATPCVPVIAAAAPRSAQLTETQQPDGSDMSCAIRI